MTIPPKLITVPFGLVFSKVHWLAREKAMLFPCSLRKNLNFLLAR
jgi:hypothetical protein